MVISLMPACAWEASHGLRMIFKLLIAFGMHVLGGKQHGIVKIL